MGYTRCIHLQTGDETITSMNEKKRTTDLHCIHRPSFQLHLSICPRQIRMSACTYAPSFPPRNQCPLGIMDQGRTEVSCVSRGPRASARGSAFPSTGASEAMGKRRWQADHGSMRTTLHSGPNTCLMDPNREGDVGRSRNTLVATLSPTVQ